MTNIPVGTKLKITEYVPLPEPRPRYIPEEPFSGTFNLDNLIYHPWVEMKETGKVGIELMKEQISYILEPLSRFTDLSFFNEMSDWEVTATGISIILFILSAVLLLRK